jgi:sugar phosphate isomerase/epimerase
MHNRRNFLKTLSAATIAGLTIPKYLLAMKKEKIIGIQLYTIRDMVKEDFEGTLSLLSDIGYRSVEAAGYSNRKFYGYYPKEYKKIVEGYGLMPLSSHSNLSLDSAQKTIDDTLEAGMSYLVIPSIPAEERKSLDYYKRLANEFNKIGELCQKSGLTFGYHNHDFEFKKIDGVIPYNILLENTDPDLVTMQLDLYWIMYGGFNPTEYFQQFPGRFKLWHVKDMDKTAEMESTEVGKGIINFQQIFKKQKQAGLEYIFVEQESFKLEPEESIAISYHYLKNLTAF